MFWNFCIASGFFGTPFVSSFPFVDKQPKNQQNNCHSQEEKGERLLNLTAEDHLKAGYQNNKKLWTEDQDEKLKRLREKQNLQWDGIAQQLSGRNAKMCYSRYKRLEFKSRDNWKLSEDKKLKQLTIELNGDWESISKKFPNRTVKQVKEHYLNYLRPEINKNQWTLEEDQYLVELLNKVGKNWKIIEQKMNGRTQNQIKNRYFGRLRKLHQNKANKDQKQKPVTSVCL